MKNSVNYPHIDKNVLLITGFTHKQEVQVYTTDNQYELRRFS